MKPRSTLPLSAARLLLLALALLGGGCGAADEPAATALAPDPLHTGAAAAGPLVCVVVRAYWGHGSWGDNSLVDLLWSLAQQTHERWEALIVVMDNRPFPDLHHILRHNNDSRARVFAEWISARHAPKDDATREWIPGYHSQLYRLTDAAIRACPRDTEWLVVTNGDNDYAPGFLERLIKEGAAGADAVAFDYYSRFYRPTGTPCERFAAAPGRPPCKPNLMRWCQTDLAATAYRWGKFVGLEDGGATGGVTSDVTTGDDVTAGDDAGEVDRGMLFSQVDDGFSHDGKMAEEIVKRGWKVARVSGECLVEHAPSPQTCALAGRVWDDRDAATGHSMGGKCLSLARAAKFGALPGVEEVSVQLAHDTNFGLPEGPLPIRCLRRADRASWKDMQRYFPPACAAPEDESGQEGAGSAAAAAR